MEVSGELHTPTALSAGKHNQYPLDRSLAGPRAGLYAVAREKKSVAPVGNHTALVQIID
jgi:hypothetical protein